MKFIPDLQAIQNDPAALEALYQSACKAGEEAEFREDVTNLHEQAPASLLYAAWHYRFQNIPLPKRRSIAWGLAIILGAVTGLVLWSLSDFNNRGLSFLGHTPYLILFWAPIAAILAIAFLAGVSRQGYRQAALIAAGLAVLGVYVLLIAPGQKSYQANTYLDLMAIHLPLLSWGALGLVVLGWRSASSERFAFLIKSLEVAITAGLYLMAGMAFGGITLGLFAAINVNPPEAVLRLGAFGGFGLLPILALASVYEPHLKADEQDFNQGLSRFIATMMRLLLPLTLLVLVIYVLFIPFNFMAPFETRDVLIVYNIMLFAILGLVVGVTPLKADELSPRLQNALRYGILAVAGLTTLVSLYALSAVLYRTFQDQLTINRLTIIGWNTINIGILIGVIITQVRQTHEGWEARLHNVYGKGAVAYMIWTVFLILVTPILFR
jgi:hypothetical protein